MKPIRALRAIPRACWKGARAEIALTALAAPLALIVFLSLPAMQGCATSPQGLAREQHLYQVGTNVVAGVQAVAPYLPAPVQFPTEIALAAVTAALSAWNIHQQKAISALKNGKSNGSNAPPASQASKPVPAPPTTPA
jgi:hypothetical protein